MTNKYTFKIKKGKFELEVNSDNKYFVMAQYDKIYREFNAAAGKSKKTEKPAKIEKQEEKRVEAAEPVKATETQKIAGTVKKEAVKAEAEEKPLEPAEIAANIKAVQETEEETKTEVANKIEPEKISETIEKTPEIKVEENAATVEQNPGFQPDREVDEFLYKKNFERDVPPAKQEEKPETESEQGIEAEPEKLLEKNPEFADIIKEKMQEQEESAEEETPDETPEEVSEEAETDSEESEVAEELRKSFEQEPELKVEQEEKTKKSKVYDILEEKLASLPEEEKNRLNLNRKELQQDSKVFKFKDLEDLIYLKKPQTKLDYLLISSYYLQEKEDTEKYSLKQINSAIVPHIKDPIDHSVIHEAVGHEYFEVIPDYLGTAGVTEYKITEEGVDYILNEL